ncbi:hypothetical protein PP182_15750 [Maribacter sp. PR1]|uniref:Doxx family protein n=1 Tax=Maribacter cobaltidurans TaxID=1178778 RepID=A0ABU7IX38_9FLAO|nr:MULTISPECIES: hypothetical protein [Maribacter]MDC6390147.1 hypothetical protein [Maribacter sp. PR1]MEE1977537.1 hypothetical protein [Maribacter cobaltidurans]
MENKNKNNRYLKIAIGLVYLWFGVLKFFPNVSPAEELAVNTINQLTNFLIPSNISIVLLALWETTVGLFLILGLQKKNTIRVAVIHMLLTFTPLYFFPDLIFNDTILSLTLLGQYIVKNLIILGALGILWIEVKEKSSVAQKTEKNTLSSSLNLSKVLDYFNSDKRKATT